MRASDADRERAVEILHQHAGDGRISLDELSQRTENAYQAQTLGELDALVRDLPPAPPGSRNAVGRVARGVVVPMGRGKRLRYTAIRLGIVNGGCVGIWLATGGLGAHPPYFWPAWPLVGSAAWLSLRAVRRAERRERAANMNALATDWHQAFQNIRGSRRPK